MDVGGEEWWGEGYWEACGYRQSLIFSISLICVLLDWGSSPSYYLRLKSFLLGPRRQNSDQWMEALGKHGLASKNHTAKVPGGVAGRLRSWLLPSL